MTKHSKNNTASSIFSYAEYKKLDYGTKRVSIPPLHTPTPRPCPSLSLSLCPPVEPSAIRN